MNTMTNNLRTYGLKVILSDEDALSSKAVCPFLLMNEEILHSRQVGLQSDVIGKDADGYYIEDVSVNGKLKFWERVALT